MSSKNRKDLFVEVHQKDLKSNIFKPIHNLYKYESNFFPKRFAILGGYKTGKTELGKFIIDKMKQHYKNLISIVINSQEVKLKGLDEIKDWLYQEWYLQLFQISNPEFKDIVVKQYQDFKEIRGNAPEKNIDRIYFICEAYRSFLKLNPDAKFIIEFDQANVIEEESQFTPFYQFWRHFQGHWENDLYFSELPIFIFVIGHKNWIDFAALKDSVGRGVFDTWVMYDYWSTLDIEEMFKKRLIYAIKPENQDELLDYFIGSGLIDYLGKRLGKINTAEYLEVFFKQNIMDYLENFQYNRENYGSFSDFCKDKAKTDKRVKDKYFVEVEKAFHGTPALDYMPVFRFLSDNQNENWFNELFSLKTLLYEKKKISFESKDFRKHKNLTHQFITDNFTRDGKTGTKPNYYPPLFLNFEKDLILNDAFLGCLDAIDGLDRYGAVSLLKRFVKSKRLYHSVFVESTDGKKIEKLLDEIKENINNTFKIVQKWVVHKKQGIIIEHETLDEGTLSPFYELKEDVVNLNNHYEKNSTNWAIFDNIGRTIANTLIDKTFPDDSFIYSQLDVHIFNGLRDIVLDDKTSNIEMAKSVNDLLKTYLSQLNYFNTNFEELKEKPKKKAPKKKLKSKNNVAVFIDGPNSLGEDYNDALNLKSVIDYAHSIDLNAQLFYFTKINENRINKEEISIMGYNLSSSHKDVDYLVMNKINECLDSKNPPNTIILSTKDQDFTDFIKKIRKDHDVHFLLAISSVLGLSKSLKSAFYEGDIKFFPEKEFSKEELKERIFKFQEGKGGKPIARNHEGKICFPYKHDEIQPNIGEKWICEIEMEMKTYNILKLIRKLED